MHCCNAQNLVIFYIKFKNHNNNTSGELKMNKNKKILANFLSIFFLSLFSMNFYNIVALQKNMSAENDLLIKYFQKETVTEVKSLSLFLFLEFLEKEMNLAYELTLQARNGLVDEASNQEEEAKKNLDAYATKIQKDRATLTQVRELLTTICTQLNYGGYPELRIKFVHICNYFDHNTFHDGFELRNLRAFIEEVKNFNKYVEKVYSQVQSFGQNNQKNLLYGKILYFNKLLINNIDSHWQNYIPTTMMDKVFDRLIFRPYEWLCRNPGVAFVTALLIGAGISYFYIYPWYLKKSLANRHPNLLVAQPPVLRQRGAMCPIHAIYNFVKLNECIRDNCSEEEMERRLNNQADFNQFRDLCAELRPGLPLENLADDDVVNLLVQLNNRLHNINIDNVTVVPSIEAISAQNALTNLVEHFERRRNARILRNEAFNDPQPTMHNAFDEINNYLQVINGNLLLLPNGNLREDLGVRYNRFRNAQVPQFFIINTGSTPTTFQEAQSRGGHWITYACINDQNRTDGMRIIAANSTNWNITDHPAVDHINRILRRN